MAQLTLSDLQLVLRDLFEHRVEALHASGAGRLYAPQLKARLEEIDGLPASVVATGRPLSEELSAGDSVHDGFGKAVYYLIEAHLVHPTLEPSLREAARRLRTTFMPGLSELARPLAEEAAAARDRATHLDRHKEDLARFPVAGGTLYDWVGAFIEEGKKLETLLNQPMSPAAAAAASTRAGVTSLRGNIAALLQRFRATLADEQRHDKTGAVSAALDGEIFSYLDELSRARG